MKNGGPAQEGLPITMDDYAAEIGTEKMIFFEIIMPYDMTASLDLSR